MKTTHQATRIIVWLLIVAIGFYPFGAYAQTIHFHNDIAGSPLAATNEDGSLAWRQSYRPYGERMLTTPDNNKLWFHGKEADNDTGLSYFGARSYDPVLGRFLGVDPNPFTDENLQSFNRYAYGNNNAYKYRDPDGRFAKEAILLAVAWGLLATAWGIYNSSQKKGGPSSGGKADLSGGSGGQLDPCRGLGICENGTGDSQSPPSADKTPATTDFVTDAVVKSRGNVIAQGTVDVRQTLEGIKSGTISPRNIFRNDEGLLPRKPVGYYQEYVHPTPGVRGAGPQRIIRGQGGEFYYSPDHYETFIPLNGGG